MTTTTVWTGERVSSADPLYQSYVNRAIVRDDAGVEIGEILHLPNGMYQPRVTGIMGEDCLTADSAARAVTDLHTRFRA